MRQPLRAPAPPAPPTAHGGGGGGDGDGGLILRSISPEARRAALLLWRWQWQRQRDVTSEDEEPPDAQLLESWQGDSAPSGWFGRLEGRSLGAHVAGRLEGLIGIRYEIETCSLGHFASGKHKIVVDGIVVGPSMPHDLRMLFHAHLTECVVQLGEYHGMNVVFPSSDFGI